MAKAKKPVAASGKPPEKKAAADEIVEEVASASDSRPTIDQLVAILILLFQRQLGSDAIRNKTHLRYHFFPDESDKEKWLGLVPIINADPAISATGLRISIKQMKDARTIVDIAARLLAGQRKFPKLSPFHKGLAGPAVKSDEAIGKAKPAGGQVTGSDRLQGEGVIQEVKGKGQRALDDAKDTVRRGSFRGPTIAPKTSIESATESTTEPVAAGQAEESSGSGQPEPNPSFFFRLEGAAHGDEALWGGEFDLLFLYGRVSDDALAIVKETKLDRVKKGQVALGVEVVASGLRLAQGGGFQLVKFKDGAMVGEPPSFALKAPEQRDADDEPTGVYVTFTVTGAIIYSFFLPIRLVAKLADDPRPGRTIDLDLEEVRANRNIEPRNARFTIRKKGGPWEVSGGIFDADDDLEPDLTTLISEASLNDAYKEDNILEAIKAIADETAWMYVDERLDLPDEHEAIALDCVQRAMTVGYRLYLRFSEDPVFKKVIDLIESLPDGSKITIKTDREAFPWEFIYPLHYIDNDRPENFQPSRFWGHRFQIESLLLPTSDGEKLPARRQQAGKLHISMGLNSGIDTEEPWVGTTPLPVQVQMDFFDTSLTGRGHYFKQYTDIRNILLQADPASLIYFFCHGTAKELKFDNVNPRLTADHVNGGPDYPGWPVVFINACDTGNISPLSFYSFRSVFRKRKAAGLIAPSFPVPTMFAAMFANAFLKSYSNRQQVGKTLLNLRRELLAKNNPLGLWYSLQCPLDVSAPEL